MARPGQRVTKFDFGFELDDFSDEEKGKVTARLVLSMKMRSTKRTRIRRRVLRTAKKLTRIKGPIVWKTKKT